MINNKKHFDWFYFQEMSFVEYLNSFPNQELIEEIAHQGNDRLSELVRGYFRKNPSKESVDAHSLAVAYSRLMHQDYDLHKIDNNPALSFGTMMSDILVTGISVGILATYMTGKLEDALAPSIASMCVPVLAHRRDVDRYNKLMQYTIELSEYVKENYEEEVW